MKLLDGNVYTEYQSKSGNPSSDWIQFGINPNNKRIPKQIRIRNYDYKKYGI